MDKPRPQSYRIAIPLNSIERTGNGAWMVPPGVMVQAVFPPCLWRWSTEEEEYLAFLSGEYEVVK